MADLNEQIEQLNRDVENLGDVRDPEPGAFELVHLISDAVSILAAVVKAQTDKE